MAKKILNVVYRVRFADGLGVLKTTNNKQKAIDFADKTVEEMRDSPLLITEVVETIIHRKRKKQ